MTDQIVPPEPPTSPPLITSNPPPGSLIKFNGLEKELRIPITVQNENTTETLRVRFQLESANLTPPNDRPMPDYGCPEDVVPLSGTAVRTEYTLSIPSMSIPRSACTKLSVAISGSFADCHKFWNPRDWDKTNSPDDDVSHRALVVYWVWEVSVNPFLNSDVAQRLLSSCMPTAELPRGN